MLCVAAKCCVVLCLFGLRVCVWCECAVFSVDIMCCVMVLDMYGG